MASKSAEKLIRRNFKFLRGDNISAIRCRRHKTAPQIENDKVFEGTKLFEFLMRRKIRPGDPAANHVLQKALPAMSSPSLNYFVMQYLFNTKNQVNFDPAGALSHFIVPGLAQPSSRQQPLEFKEHIKQGQRREGGAALDPTTGKVGVSRGIGTFGFTNPRLEILKMRAARRPALAGPMDTPKQD